MLCSGNPMDSKRGRKRTEVIRERGPRDIRGKEGLRGHVAAYVLCRKRSVLKRKEPPPSHASGRRQ